jgi:plastocyanin
MISRRILLKAGGLWLAGLAWGRFVWGAGGEDVAEIFMRSTPDGSMVTFDPVGLLVSPGQRVRWVNDGNNVHTATAYHPANDHHPLRIPAAATPWNSGYLVKKGANFEVMLTVEGIYDYYCIPHEASGMVGRIIVSGARGVTPASFAPYPDNPGRKEWKTIPDAALRNFPTIPAILKKGRISGLVDHHIHVNNK